MNRTDFVKTVLSIVLMLGCSGGDNPIAPPPPPPQPNVIATPASASVVAGETLLVTISVSNISNAICTVQVAGGSVVSQNGCISVSVASNTPGIISVNVTATGNNGVVASGSTGPVNVIAKPVFSTLDTLSVDLFSPEETDSPPIGMKMLAVWTKSGIKDSAEISMVNGEGSLTIPVSLDSVQMRFDGDSRYWVRTQVLYRGDYFQKKVSIILEPRNWKIRSAQFSGQVLALSLKDGEFVPGSISGLGYNKFSRVVKQTGGSTKLLISWPASSPPIKLGIIWSKSPGTNRETDSAYYTNVVFPAVSQQLGIELFPGVIPGDTVPIGMIGVILGNGTASPPTGTAGIWANPQGEIYRGTITFSSRIHLETYGLWANLHELLHIFGKGHTCSWTTIMVAGPALAPGGACVGKQSLTITPMDVAMYEMPLAIRDMAKKKNTTFAFN